MRTNIDIDDTLMTEVMEAGRFKTKKAAVEVEFTPACTYAVAGALACAAWQARLGAPLKL